jgi:hypothetical protein
MPAPDTEPENYSIDEMMERLRSRSDGGNEGDSELVTRADGSQMYKVRKRKRRSQQPKKEKEKRAGRMQVMQVVAAGGILALGGLAFVGCLFYLNSSAFHSKIIRQAEAWTGAKLETTEVRVTPISIAAKSMIFTWPQESPLANLKVYDIKGDVRATSFLSGPWNGTEILANNGSLLLRAPTGVKTNGTPVTGELPFQFRYRSAHFNIVGGDPGTPAFQIGDTEASFTILNPDATKANLQLNGGTVFYQDWGPFHLDFASVQIENDVVRLGRASFTVPDVERTELELNNAQNAPINFASGETNYEVKASRIPLASLVGKGLASIFTCDVDTPTGSDAKKGSLSFQYGAKTQVTLSLPFRASPSGISQAARLPMFAFLANGLNDKNYLTPKFELNAQGVISRDSSGSRLEDLALETKGYISINGTIETDLSGNLGGVLEVGLPVAVAADGGSAFQAVFSRGAKGMVWASVRLSGTVENPQDDLAVRIAAAEKVAGDSGAAAGTADPQPLEERVKPAPRKPDSEIEKDWDDLVTPKH